ncbi:MAG: hypothetical protein AMXMBFR7_22680 [Planctomycetota bacterium]
MLSLASRRSFGCVRGLLVALALGLAAGLGAGEAAAPQGFHALGGATPDAGTLLAFGLLLEGKNAESEATFRARLAQTPDDAAARFGLGLLERLNGRSRESVEHLARAFSSGRQEPWAELYLHVLLEVLQEAPDDAAFLEAAAVVEGDAKVRPYLRGHARYARAAWLQARGRFTEAAEAYAPLQFIKRWALSGPFDNRDGAGMPDKYAPEDEVQFERPMRGRNRNVAWIHPPVEPLDGIVELDTLFEPNTHSLAYAATQLKLEQAQWAVLWLGCGGAAKVWVNQRQVVEVPTRHDYAPEKSAVPVYLHAGWNQILIKAGAVEDTEWSFSVRLSKPEGGPVPGVTVDPSAEALEGYKATAAGRATPLLEPENPELGLLPRLETALKAEPDSAWLQAWFGYHAYLHRFGNKEDHHPAQAYAKALKLAPRCAVFQLLLAGYPGDPNQARQSAEACLKEHPEAPAAQERLALLHHAAGLELEAEPHAREVLSKFGTERAGGAAKVLAEILRARDLQPEANGWAAQYVKQSPFDPEGWQILGSTAAGHAARRKAFEQGLEFAGGDPGLRQLWAEELMELDREAEAAAFRERSLMLLPFAIEEHLDIAEAWRRAGQPDKAAQYLEQARRIAPENTELLSALAGLRLRGGKPDEAAALWQEALRIKPNAPGIKDALAEINTGRGLDRGFFAPYEIALKDLPVPAADDYPRDNAVHLLKQEVVHVNPNGTSSRMVHQISKLLRAGGKGDLQRHTVFYDPQRQVVDVLRAAVIMPDGRELARADVGDRSVSAAMGVQTRIYDEYHLKEIVFRDIEVGALIDLQYVVRDSGENIYGDYFADAYYLGDDSPVQKSQYVLSLPKSREFRHQTFRHGAAPERVESNDPEREVLRWQAENLPGIVQERRMPPALDQLPFVQTTTMRTWQEVGTWYWNLAKEQMVVDEAIEAQVKELTANLETPTEKLRAIHDWAIEKIRYLGIEFGRNGYKPHRSTETFRALYGDCKDTSLLIATMCKAAGIDARVVLIRTVDAGAVDEHSLPAPNLFNHCIAYIPDVDGKEYWIDGTTDYHQLGEVPAMDQGAQVLVVGPEGGQFVQIPRTAAADNRHETRVTATLNAQGAAQVFVRTVATGEYAPYWRQRAGTPGQFERFIKEQIAQQFPGAELSRLTQAQPGEQGPMWFETELRVPRLATPSGDRYSLPSAPESMDLSRLYVSGAERTHDLMLWFARSRQVETVYQLDEGYKVVALPESVELKESFGRFVREVRQEGQRLTLKIDFRLDTYRIKKEEYAAFAAFCRKVDALNDEKVLVKK